MRDLFDEPISIVEDLDPEPEPTGSWLHLREVVLGLLLLVGVFVWSGWEWWHQDQQQANYSIAQQAAADQDWEKALDYFSRVEGYKDADTRATEMKDLVSERNKQYEIAASSAEKGQWAAALQASEAVRRVQRDYRDTNQLEAQASWEVYRGGLEGVVALRTQGRKPALYYRQRDSWEWLPRSDRRSQVMPTLDATGAILYDVPGENWDQVKLTPTATPAPARFRVAGTPGLEGRSLQVAWYGKNDGSPYFGVNFDPAQYNYYWIGEKGMWGIRQDEDRISQRPRVMTGYGAILVDYQPFGSSKPEKVDVQPDWTYVDFAPDGEHILLVQEGATLDLYVADGTGGNRKLLYKHDGSIGGVQFSPDSKYALLTAYSYIPGGTTIYRVVLIDIEKGTPQTLIERALKGVGEGSNYPLPVAGGFLRQGRFKGFVLVADDTADPARVYLFAPGRPAPMLNMPVESVPAGAVWAAQSGDSTLLMWQGEGDTGVEGQPLVMLEMGPEWSVTESTLLFKNREFLVFGGTRDNWLLFGTAEVTGRDPIYNIYSMPLGQLHEKPRITESLYSTELPQLNEATTAQTVYAGQTMFSYIEKGDLHVRTYDKKVDLTLENGVLHLYTPATYRALIQMR